MTKSSTDNDQDQETARDQQPIGHRFQHVNSAVIGIAAVLVTLLGFFVYAAADSDGSEEGSTTTLDESTTTEGPRTVDLSEEVLAREPPDPERPPAGLAVDALDDDETLMNGQGPAAATGDTVTFHYVGKIADGSVFDSSWPRSSWEPGEPVSITLGLGNEIDGWHEGLVGVKAGERRRLELGHENAYGVDGSSNGAVPPRASVAFEIDVLRIDFSSGPS